MLYREGAYHGRYFPAFNLGGPGPSPVEFVVYKTAMRQVFLLVLSFFPCGYHSTKVTYSSSYIYIYIYMSLFPGEQKSEACEPFKK
jgi:hypothetical protein